uniref:Uncharacterized protein n=1 Tax=Oryza meridionalis TaxID=40149 RepID=A0A0E0ECH6_9ORYZ
MAPPRRRAIPNPIQNSSDPRRNRRQEPTTSQPRRPIDRVCAQSGCGQKKAAGIGEKSSSSSSSHRGCERDKGKRARDISTAAASASASAARSTMLAVLCGKVGKQRTPPGPVPESQRPRPSFPFQELISSGRLDVHTLINPTVDQFLEAQRALQPRFIYLQGQLLDNEEEIGTLVWGDADVSDPQTFSSLICSPFPTIGISYIMYWRYLLSSYAASHFRHSLLSVVQSSCSHAWDAFQLAYASFEQYCVRNNQVQRLMLGPHLLGDAPRIYITPPGSKMAEEEDTSEYFPDIKIYDEDVHLKLLICGAHCTPDSSILNSLEDGLNALLNIESRWCKLQDRVSAAAPLHVDSALLDGVVTICCDITTSSSSHVSLLLSGSPQTCFDDELLDKHIKKELIESHRLVRVVSVCEDDGPSSAEPLTSMSVASGASTFEVLMTLPKWAAQVLKYLAQETSYKSLVPLGIASVNGTPVSSFDKEDVDRLLFFCTNQDEDEAFGNGLYHHLPRWSASLAKDRVKGNIVSKPAMAQIQSSSLVNCTLLAVLCGKVTDKQRKPPSLVPEVKRPWLSCSFPELISSGRLEELDAHHHTPKQSSMVPPLARLPVGDLPCDPDFHPKFTPPEPKPRAKHNTTPATHPIAYESSSSSSPSRRGRDREKGKRARDISTAAALASAAVAISTPSSSSSAAAATKSSAPCTSAGVLASRESPRLQICGVLCSTMPHFPSGSRVKCTMLAVLCGKVGKQRTPPGPVPESQRPRPSFPFPELISSGRLDVHTLINPTVDQFWRHNPRFMYFQGQQLDKEEEIGRLVWGDADVSDPQIFSSLICPPFPTIVYLEVPSGEKIAQSLQSKLMQPCMGCISACICFV